jgi:MFS family permease
VAATLVSFPAGRLGDRLGPIRVVAIGVALFAAAYVVFAVVGTSIALLAICFIAAGLAIGCTETAEHAAVASLAPADLRGSAFGLLAAVQSFGNRAAGGVAGVLWTANLADDRPALRSCLHGPSPRAADPAPGVKVGVRVRAASGVAVRRRGMR